MMELVLWRHADAKDGAPDDARELTLKGRGQAQRMAAWLNERLPADARILVSPAMRAQQTAAALKRAVTTVDELGTQASAGDMLKAVAWPRAQGVTVVVGHQPTLGEVAALLLTDEATPQSVRKGAVWWFAARERHGRVQAVLRAVMAPDMA
jgi:phosphohistidine phosphatase